MNVMVTMICGCGENVCGDGGVVAYKVKDDFNDRDSVVSFIGDDQWHGKMVVRWGSAWERGEVAVISTGNCFILSHKSKKRSMSWALILTLESKNKGKEINSRPHIVVGKVYTSGALANIGSRKVDQRKRSHPGGIGSITGNMNGLASQDPSAVSALRGDYSFYTLTFLDKNTNKNQQVAFCIAILPPQPK